jgi:ABC-type transport system substrate-binding protein
VLRIGIPEPSSVDPAQAYDAAGRLIVSAMCDPLVDVDPKTGELYGALLKHVVAEAKGGGVTLTLKDGLTFPDGSAAKVKDVRASLSRVASDTLASPLAEELKDILGFGFVHGDVAVKNEDDPVRTLLLGTTQVTAKVITVAPGSPDAELGHHLGRTWSAVTPAKLSDRSDFAMQPVCVGPYRLAKAWHPGDTEIRLLRSKHYFAGNDSFTGGGRGYPDEIQFRIYPSEDAAFIGWLHGDVDVARVPRNRLATPTPGGHISTHATPSVEYVGLPTTTPPFDRPAVRAMLSASLDRSALLATRKDRAAVNGLLPDVLPGGFNDSDRCRDLAPAHPDMELARQIAAKKGVSLRGVAMRLYVNDEPGSDNVATMRAIAAQWQKAWGIVPMVVPLTWSAYQEQAQGSKGFDGPFRTSWASSAPAPDTWLGPLFLSANIGATNLSRFSNPYIDRSWDLGVLKENDFKVRHDNELKIAKAVCSWVPMVPLWSGTESFVVRDTVASATDQLQRALDGDLNVRELYLKH